jgi:DNA polymerase III epsilon subunit-like protein
VDVETGGLDYKVNSLLSIGAVDMLSGESFYGTCRSEKKCDDKALEINGIDLTKWNNEPSVENTMFSFQSFLNTCKSSLILAGMNPRFDYDFINQAYMETGMRNPFPFRTIDLHTIAYEKFGESLSLNRICVKLGMGKEPDPHNALTGAKYEAEAFAKLLSNGDLE